MTITSNRRRKNATGVIAAIALTLTVALGGCAAGGAPDKDLEVGDAKAAYSQWQDSFHSCMKDKGFDMSKIGDDGQIDGDATAFEAAAKECVDKLGNPPADPDVPSIKEMNEQELAFAKCMREAGYDYPDPKIDPNGEGVSMSPAMPSDWDQKVIEQCSKDAGMLKDGAQ